MGSFHPALTLDDPHWIEVVLAAKMKDLLLNLDRSPVGMPLRDEWTVHQTGITVLPTGLTPSVEAAAVDPKIDRSSRRDPSLQRAAVYEVCTDPCS